MSDLPMEKAFEFGWEDWPPIRGSQITLTIDGQRWTRVAMGDEGRRWVFRDGAIVDANTGLAVAWTREDAQVRSSAGE